MNMEILNTAFLLAIEYSSAVLRYLNVSDDGGIAMPPAVMECENYKLLEKMLYNE